MILPIHPHPKTDELLSSWIIRLALNNGFYNHAFTTQILGYKGSVWSRDIDKGAPEDLIDSLSAVTGQNRQAIRELDLLSYGGELFTWNDKSAMLPWVLPLSLYHRNHLNAGLQICPKCLLNDSSPYYRKRWRLSLYTVCIHHGCMLLDHCPFCGACIQFHRLGIGAKSENCPNYFITQCYNCKNDLRNSPTVSIEEDKYSTSYFDFLTRYEKGLSVPNTNCTANYLSTFIGLRCLLKAILRRRSHLLLEHYSKHYRSPDVFHLEQRHIIEKYDVVTRYYTMCLLCWLIDDWPQNFKDVASRKLMPRSSLSEDMVELPFWLKNQIDTVLPGKREQPSKAELRNMLAYVQSQHGYFSVPIMRKTLRISRDTAAYYIKVLSKLYGIKIKKDAEHCRYKLADHSR